MDTSSKNLLQEYCMKNKFSLPNYRIRKQTGPIHSLRFQVEVEVNGQSFVGDDLYTTREQAEQSAARRALEVLATNDIEGISTQLSNVQIVSDEIDLPPSYAEAMKLSAIEHLTEEYVDIERYISIMVESFGGQVRKIWAPTEDGLYKFEIAGSYQYCDNAQRHHKRNQIYLMVDPMNQTYYQMCLDPKCSDFRSITRNIVIKRQTSIG